MILLEKFGAMTSIFVFHYVSCCAEKTLEEKNTDHEVKNINIFLLILFLLTLSLLTLMLYPQLGVHVDPILQAN